ncbi:AP-3 complex subunit delta [Arachnomyces sp. PD_36]|nr:AP-3 complex subunit delta [Arachnomyces sp. PD_36]
MSLPLVALPHIITPSLALSLLSDLLPRLSHSHAVIRKKTVVSLYRLALVYPEALRLAWPKIKDRLMDDQEESSVTAAVINVVCELGWRRPQDFLALAPRLFDLLVDGGNNWMAIKIIKLFATLTPLEPRLIRKLLRPLTNIIHTTSAMSLLYECINGVIQGGILDGVEGIREGDEIADLCVSKLRGMIVVEGDPNLKYVALLAFNRIVVSHPTLVSMQQDVIMDCLDDPDISIRLQALELASGMVTSDNLQMVVIRLIRQLQASPIDPGNAVEQPLVVELRPSADLEGDDPEKKLEPTEKSSEDQRPLPNDYRNEVLHRILDICSRNTYSAIVDFEWYVEILVQLLKLIPPPNTTMSQKLQPDSRDIASRIGAEIRNVAVRVKSVRPDATRAAESILLIDNREILFPASSASCTSILDPIAWVVGEYAEHLAFPDRSLNSLIHASNLSLPARVLSSYLQAIPKLFVSLIVDDHRWDSAKQSEAELLLARIIRFLEELAMHPDLDVQERTTEFLELLRLSAEGIAASNMNDDEMPLLLSSAIPSLFSGLDLNPVAVGAQKKVPIPPDLDLDEHINEHLAMVLQTADGDWLDSSLTQDEFHYFYQVRDTGNGGKQRTKEILPADLPQTTTSYQNMEPSSDDPDLIARRRAERRTRNKDDPFYIGHEDESSSSSTPFDQIIRNTNGEELDLDSIPIIDLAVDDNTHKYTAPAEEPKRKHRSRPKKVEISAEETIDVDDFPSDSPDPGKILPSTSKSKRSLLQVDSSGLGQLSLEDDNGSGAADSRIDIERKAAEEAEMAKAMKEVERLRLEMQRASERIQAAHGVPSDGTLVKRKKKKKTAKPKDTAGESSVKEGEEQTPTAGAEEEAVVVSRKTEKKKKKKKKQPVVEGVEE